MCFYDAYGNVTRYQSAEGRVTEYEFDAPRRERTREVDALGFESVLVYHPNGMPSQRTDRLEKPENWDYNQFGQPTLWVNRRGHSRTWEYDTKGNLLHERAMVDDSVLKLLRSHTYDSRGNRVSTSEYQGDGRVAPTLFAYDSSRVSLVKITDPNEAETRITPDLLGRPVRIEADRTISRGGVDVVEPVVVTRSYDKLDRLTVETDAGKTDHKVEYDPNGLVLRTKTLVPVTGGSGTRERVDLENTYDAMDRLASATNALGHTAIFAYDERDRRTHTTTPLGRETETIYDLDGNPIEMIDPSGVSTKTAFDPLNRPIRTIDGLGRVFSTSYDREGRVLKRREPGEIAPRVVFYGGYDAVGNLVAWEGVDGVVTRQTFDRLSRRRTLVVGAGTVAEATTTFAYDWPGRLLSKTDANQHSTSVSYDRLGRAQTVTDALMRPRQSVVYDELGNTLEVEDADGNVIKREHDSRGLILEEHDVASDRTIRLRYDDLGRLVRREGPSGDVATFTHDDLDRVSSQITSAGIERFVYDDDGFFTQHVQPSAQDGTGDPLVVNYAYDSRGLLRQLSDREAGTFLFEADVLGRPVRRASPGGDEWRAFYTAEGWISRIEVAIAAPAASIQSIKYMSHDARGYPTTIRREAGAAVVETLTLEHDVLGRLKSVKEGALVLEAYTYDGVGNRKTQTDQGGSRSFHYDAADQLTTITAGLSGGGALLESFVYTDAGRRDSQTVAATNATKSYEYDGYGRLLRVQRTGYAADLTYGADGRRIQRVETGSTSSYPTTRLEHRGASSFRLLRAGGFGAVIAEVDSTASPVRTHTLHRDGSQNVGHVSRRQVGASATLEASPRRWTAFGTLRTGSSSLERGYASQAVEGQTGLLYMGARHYDPNTGRFLQPDPLGIEAGELYAYARSNPYLFWDPSGLSPESFSSDSIAPMWEESFDLGDRVLAPIDSRGGVLYPEIVAAESYVAEALDAATFGLLSSAVTAYSEFQESLLGPPRQFIGGTGPVAFPLGGAVRTLSQLEGAAAKALQEMGPGSGAVFGTRVHSAFEAEVAALGRADLATEVSYLSGRVVPRGTRGSVRLDVVEGGPTSPTAVFDLKTGGAHLTPSRIQQILDELPGGKKIPVTEVRGVK